MGSIREEVKNGGADRNANQSTITSRTNHFQPISLNSLFLLTQRRRMGEKIET